MTQLDLFGEPDTRETVKQLNARRKSTSQQALEEVPLGLKHNQVLSIVPREPSTANELANLAQLAYGGQAETYRKRVRELERLGLLVEGDTRQCSITGANATVFTLKRT